MTNIENMGARDLRQIATKHPAWAEFMAANSTNAALVTKGQLTMFLKAHGIYAVEGGPIAAPAPRAFAKPAASVESLDALEPEELELIERIRAKRAGLDETRVIELIKAHSGAPATVNLSIDVSGVTHVSTGEAVHYAFPLLLSAVGASVNAMLVGPAGSGKTTAAEKVAHALDLPFFFTGAIDSPYKLTGFIDAQGRVVRTAFREAYEHGGVFLFDEIDASMPSAVLAFNAALANGHMDFPDGMVPRNLNFRAIAAANTFGNGASRQYVGRNQQDAAALDRFAVIEWNYDEALEAAMLGLPRPSGAPMPRDIAPVSEEKARALVAEWVETIRKTRAAVDKLALRHVVSPRASLFGARLLAAGWSWAECESAVLFKGLDGETRAKIKAAVQ